MINNQSTSAFRIRLVRNQTFETYLILLWYFAISLLIYFGYVAPGTDTIIAPPAYFTSEPSDYCTPPPSTALAITALGTSGQRAIPVGSNISGLRRWSQTSSWPNGTKPGVNDDVVISANTMLVLDENVNVRSITVQGQLIVDITRNIQVSTNYLLITGTGAYFEWGTASEKYQQKGTLTLTGSVSTTNDIPKSIMITNNGRIELHGKTKTSWTTLAANVSTGANQIQVTDDNHQWEVGDEIVIVSSRLSQNEAEKRTITALSTDRRTLTLNTPLAFPHIGRVHTYYRQTDGKSWVADMRAEVGLLSKNIKIQGDNNSPTNGHGGHFMIHTRGIANVEFVELYRMGHKNIMARYPFHWHLMEDRAQGQYFRNNSVHESYNRAITIHGTESVFVENNFCYDHIGHGLFLEDGSERFNTIRNNVVVLTKRPQIGEALTPSDNEANEVQNRTPSSFWITNPNNTVEGNVAAGTEGTGFWFALPRTPTGLSAALPRYSGMQPFREQLGVFRNNKAHSCVSGFDIFDQLNADHGLIKNGAWERTDVRLMQSCTFYACDLAVYGGIGGGRDFTEDVIFRDNIFVDNRTAVMHANYSMIENSVFVAKSGENVFSGERRLNRGYDGSCTIKDCHMVGWQASDANYVQNTGGAMKHVNYRITGMTMDHPGPPRMNFPDYSVIPRGGVGANDIAHPRFWSYVHWDMDGSVSGKPNTSIVTNHPLCRDGSEVRYENWTNLYRTDRRFAYMLLDFPGDPKMTIVRTKAGTPKAGQYYINTDGPDGYYGTFIHFPVMVNDGFLYTLQFESMGSSRSFNLHMMDDYTPGDQVLYRIRSFGSLAGITVSNATRHSTLAQLRTATQTGFAIDNGDLYIKMVSVTTSPDIVCTVSWTGNITLPVLDTDGDGISDYQETVNGTDPVGNDPIPLNPVLSVPSIQTVWEFNTPGNTEGWSQLNNVTGSVSGGQWGLQINGSDPQIQSSNPLFIPATTYRYVRVRARSSVAGQLQLYWSRDGGYGYSPSRFASIPVKAVPGEFIDYYFDLSTDPDWINKIQRIRIDPEVGTGQTISIDRISFETSLPACSSSIATSATTICAGTPLSLSATTSPGADYIWRNGTTVVGGNTSTYSVTTSGSYTVETVFPSGCRATSAARTITVTAIPSIPTAPSPITYCQGATATALTASGTNLKWYTVASGGTALSAAPIPSTGAVGTTNYYVSQSTGTCESGRRLVTVTVNPTPAIPTAPSPITYCQGATATALTASGTNLKWYTVATGGTALSAAPIPSTVAAGTTNYYVSQSTGTCESGRRLVTVTVNPTPAIPTAPSPIIYCQGATATVLTASGTNLKWYTVASGGTALSAAPIPSTVAAGTTNYYVSQSTGTCESGRRLVAVTVNPTPVATISPSSAIVLLPGMGQNITANNGSGLLYQWMKDGVDLSGATNRSYDVNSSGEYSVRVSTTSNCSSLSAGVQARLNQSGSINFTTQVNNTVFSSIIFDVSASDPDGIAGVDIYDGTTLLTTLTQSPYQYTYTNVSIGSHALRVVVRDIFGGTTEQSQTVLVTGITTSSTIAGIPSLEYYPNPFSDYLTLKLEGAFRYTILDSKGTAIQTGEATSVEQVGAILSGGMYLLIIEQGNRREIVKVHKVN